MLSFLKSSAQRSWMGIYLRVLAVIMAYGASVHLGNVLGWGGQVWSETPVAWRIGDVGYLGFDLIAALGLWQRTAWGILCFLMAMASQLLIYTFFIHVFAFTPEQQQTVYGLLGTEVILVAVLIGFLMMKK